MEQKGEMGKEFKSQVYHNLISKVTYDYYSFFFFFFFVSCCNSLKSAGGKNSAELTELRQYLFNDRQKSLCKSRCGNLVFSIVCYAW